MAVSHRTRRERHVPARPHRKPLRSSASPSSCMAARPLSTVPALTQPSANSLALKRPSGAVTLPVRRATVDDAASSTRIHQEYGIALGKRGELREGWVPSNAEIVARYVGR